MDCNIYLFNKLCKGHVVDGPAVIMDKLSTILIEPMCKAVISKSGDIGKSSFIIYSIIYNLFINLYFILEIEVKCDQFTKISTELEPIQLSIFSHRFMSIAEQMGRYFFDHYY